MNDHEGALGSPPSQFAADLLGLDRPIRRMPICLSASVVATLASQLAVMAVEQRAIIARIEAASRRVAEIVAASYRRQGGGRGFA